MRVRLVIEMDATFANYKNITDRITDMALKTLKRRGGHLVSVYHDAAPTPYDKGLCLCVTDKGEFD